MATNPSRSPLDDEIEAMYRANPGLAAHLDELERRIARGEVEPIEDAEVRDRLRSLGVQLVEPE